MWWIPVFMEWCRQSQLTKAPPWINVKSNPLDCWTHGSSTSHLTALPFNFFPFPEGKSMHSQAEANTFCSASVWNRLIWVWRTLPDDFMKTSKEWSNTTSTEGMVLLQQEMKLLSFNPSQILFTDHSQDASHNICPHMGFSDGYLQRWQEIPQLWRTWIKLCVQLWKGCVHLTNKCYITPALWNVLLDRGDIKTQ